MHCAICQTPIGDAEEAVACPDCAAPYHADCWQENGGCAVYGCASVPATEGRRTLEIPAAYWGREDKPCPSCGTQILAAAVRCRQCGATFASARPEETGEFHQRQQTERALPAARRAIVWQFILCLIPCTAPVTVLVAWRWRAKHQAELAAVPTVYGALSRIGFVVGAIQALLLVVLGVLFSVFRSH